MNKDNGETAQIATSGADTKPDTARLFFGKTSRFWTMFLAPLLIIIVIIGFVIWHIAQSSGSNFTASDNQKIQQLTASFNCSASSMASVASLKPNTSEVNNSLALIGYRESCDMKNRDYTKAISDLKQEVKYCQLDNNSPCVNDDQSLITNLSNSLKSDSSASSESSK